MQGTHTPVRNAILAAGVKPIGGARDGKTPASPFEPAGVSSFGQCRLPGVANRLARRISPRAAASYRVSHSQS